MPKPVSKPIIAVDIDEVLSPLRSLIFAHHNNIYGTNYPLNDRNYFIDRLTGDSNEITRKKLKKFVDSEAFQNIKPFKEAIKVLNILKSKFEFIIVTSRQDFYYDFTHHWLEEHFPKTFIDVHFTEHITGVELKIPKSKFCIDSGASWIIDDNIDTAMECSEAGLGVLLFGNYPWNQADELPKNVKRVKNWQEVLEYFNE